AVIGESNVLVEGVTDQILIANRSSLMEPADTGKLNLNEVSIIPFGDLPVLEQLIATIHSRGAKVVVVSDLDEGGQQVRRYCRRLNVQVIRDEDYAMRAGKALGIEDTLPLEFFVSLVNEFYTSFTWFQALDVERVRVESANKTIGRYLEEFFHEAFKENFNKK